MRTHDDFMRDADATSSPLHHAPDRSPDEDRRKKTRTIHPASQTCRDWMIVSGNVHYARDQASFVPSTYTPVHTPIKSNIFNPLDEMVVAGIGTVHLTVPRGVNDPSTHTIVLENVLHIPEALCNGFNPLLVGSSMSCLADRWEGCDRFGRGMWYGTRFCGLGRLVLAPGPDGQAESDLIEGREYTLSLYVSAQEKAAVAEQVQAQAQRQAGGMMGQVNGIGMGQGMMM
ncbi:uncharacterized protein DSM5745_07851 [Aspergillus mulundensis]|uniref:Uncharacterized protein n=1 Tax=Aspergillus mulundensis TaxID=1810919 RepID=A0A3D8RF56_9EURO|nr:Uncharacterized protein DSM5745_07851 [Aspergillus mulundensis]RDW72679.1 Uncharacterized protein DSM5745_07851 [Aspergillus mulundensis]